MKRKRIKTIPLCVRMSPATKRKLVALALHHKRSMGSMIDVVICDAYAAAALEHAAK